MMTVRAKMCAMRCAALLGCVLVQPVQALAATDTPPSEFAWRGALTLPTGASLARVDVPVQAMLHMQSSAAHDVRVFNAAGTAVPFAILAGADLGRATPALHTGNHEAYPLYAATSAGRPARGGVEVRVDTAGSRGSAWVRWDNAEAKAGAGPQALPAALFDLREQRQTVDAFTLVVDLPHNALVPVSVAVSADLKDWTELAVKGPLYQFDGVDAPFNTTLELRQPLQLQGRYLKLAWPGQTGVKVQSLAGRVAATQSPPEHLRTPLPPGVVDANGGLSWSLPFATAIAAVHLQAAQDNTLVPVRIQGRSEASQPWRTLASTVVYRLDSVGPKGSSNPATPLRGASLRALRVEASPGNALPAGGLQATVEFAPLQVAFLASGAGPFTLSVGRANTPAAAMDASLLGSIAPAKLVELPMASFADVQVQEPTQGRMERMAAGWLPDGVPLRSVLLWAVLGAGVLALGGVAYSLMRQLAVKR